MKWAVLHVTVSWDAGVPSARYNFKNAAGTIFLTTSVNAGGASAGSISQPDITWTAADNQVSQGVTTFSSIDYLVGSAYSNLGDNVYRSGGRVLTGKSETGATSTNPGERSQPDTVYNIDYHLSTTQTTHTVHLSGSIKANCSTQHMVDLYFDGVFVGTQVTSAAATRQAPSTVTVTGNFTEAAGSSFEGKSWEFRIDGNSYQSGNVHYAAGQTDYSWTMVDPNGATPVFFDCAPPQGNLNLSGGLHVPARSVAHTLSATLNGAAVASWSSAENSSQDQVIGGAQSIPNVDSGSLVRWYVDGVLQRSDTVVMTPVVNDGVTTYQYTDVFDATAAPGGTPAPTPVITPTPPSTPPPATPTPPPQTTATPGNTQITTPGGTTVVGNNVFVTNPQDIYKPITDALGKLPNARDIYDAVRNALNDSAQGGTVPDFTTPDATPAAGRGHLDDLQGQADTWGSKTDGMVSKMQSISSGLKGGFNTLPTSLGTVTTLPFGLHGFQSIVVRGGTNAGNAAYTDTIDLSPYSNGIALGRQVMLWGLTIFFLFLTVRAFTWTQ